MRKALLSLLALVISLLASASARAGDDTTANINVAFVTDLSGSMKSNNLVDPTKSFLTEFVKHLYAGDRVVMANFGTNIAVNNPMNISQRNHDNDIATLVSVIDGYQFNENFTYTSGALDASCQALNRQQGPKVLILLSDGKEEVPPGEQPKWDTLATSCSSIAIHVIALTEASKPTLQQIGTKLGAKVHDATKHTLTEIGNEIRQGIRVFVTVNQEKFQLGNLPVGESAETRATFTLTGASNTVELKPSGEFPPGANFTCANFTAPGDAVCSVVLTDAVQPGTYSGKISFTPTQGNLAVVTPTLTVEFSRGVTQVTASKNEINLGAMRPGETQAISIDFESGDSSTPQPITLSLSGFPDGMVMLEPTTIMAPAENVELKFTFNSGDPGDYSGQLLLQSSSPTMQVQPAALSVSFHRRPWYSEFFWAYWYVIIPSTVVLLVLIAGLRYRFVVLPRKREAEKPLLKGRLVRLDTSEAKLDSTLQEQTVDGLTFLAEGTRNQTRIKVRSSDAVRIRYPDSTERFTAPNQAIALVHNAVILTSDGQEIGTFLCLGLRK